MPISFNCACGKTLRVPDASAGRRAKCPSCGAVVEVPTPEPEFEVVEDAPKPAPKPEPATPAKPYGKLLDDEEEYDGTTYRLADSPRTRNKDDDSDGGDDGGAPPPKKNKLPNFRKGRDKHT